MTPAGQYQALYCLLFGEEMKICEKVLVYNDENLKDTYAQL